MQVLIDYPHNYF